MRDRRDFLRWGLGSALASVAIGNVCAAAEPQIRRYVRLGKTELKVSDISFGSASFSDPALVRHAFERGVAGQARQIFSVQQNQSWRER